MIEIEIPGRGTYRLRHLVLDVNGTIAHDGELVTAVADAVRLLAEQLHVVIITADTRGTAASLARTLGADVEILTPGDEAAQKGRFVRSLGAGTVVAVGNGANDESMLHQAEVGIAVIGGEGASATALAAADVVVTDVRDALGLLAEPRRLIATLRR